MDIIYRGKKMNSHLSPWTNCPPHFEHAKHLTWKTGSWIWLDCEFGPIPGFICDDVRITSSLAGIIWPHAAQAPVWLLYNLKLNIKISKN